MPEIRSYGLCLGMTRFRGHLTILEKGVHESGSIPLNGTRYDKTTACLAKDRDVLLTFYDFSAEHWKHIRTTKSH
jgi:hypothetical protein